MIRLTAEEFWPQYRDEGRATGYLDALPNTGGSWTRIVTNAAIEVCESAGLQATSVSPNLRESRTSKELDPACRKACKELHLDVMGYEQRQPGIPYDWDLRVAFEHENDPRTWHDELCKLCHIVAGLRVLAGYFKKGVSIEELLQERIDLMGDRVLGSEWLFIFGPWDSSKDPIPWAAYVLDQDRRLVKLRDDSPFCPHIEFS